MKKAIVPVEKNFLDQFFRSIEYDRPLSTLIDSYSIHAPNLAPKDLSPTREQLKDVREMLEM